MHRLTLLAMALLAGSAAAQTLPCTSRVVPYEAGADLLPGDTLRLETPGGVLLYLGAEHTSDSAHPFIATLERHFAAFRPEVVFFEGPDRGVRDTRDETIQALGETGYTRFLARSAGARVERLEPSPRDEFRYVADTLGAERAALFFVLREAARLRERRGLAGASLREAIAELLAQAAPLGLPVPTLDELARLYQAHVPGAGDWMDVPGAWFDPLSFSPDAHFFPAANRASSHYRNLHMVEVVGAAVKSGHRVLAVVGRHHLPRQADALRCLLQPGTP